MVSISLLIEAVPMPTVFTRIDSHGGFGIKVIDFTVDGYVAESVHAHFCFIRVFESVSCVNDTYEQF
jgi:hypothetical protein